MTGIELGVADWLRLLTHLKRWLSNLSRAGEARRQASKQALRDVIKAVRETTVYLRSLREGAGKSIDREGRLAVLWTELAFQLEDLGLHKLAKRCHITGRYWADPESLDQDFLREAGVRLGDIERLARASLNGLRKK